MANVAAMSRRNRRMPLSLIRRVMIVGDAEATLTARRQLDGSIDVDVVLVPGEPPGPATWRGAVVQAIAGMKREMG